MLIDMIEAKKAFKEYVKKYNPEDEKIKIKIAHIERVAENSKRIAENLNLSQEDIELAELIGLLHDIGRFEQVRLYHTFVDKDSINHGEYGAKVLFEDGLIRKFIKDDKFDRIIKLAIVNHNRADIEEGLTEREKLHAKIIRDADKIDIFYESAEIFWNQKENVVEESNITPKVLEKFENQIQVKREDKKTPIDDVISVMAFIFDINFKESFEILKKENYINKTLNRYKMNDSKTQNELENIRKIANMYIEQKIK